MHVTIREAQAHLAQLIRRAAAGEEVVLGEAGEPLAKLIPYRVEAGPRQGGQWRGRVWVADDFDAPDPELERAFSGEKP